MATKPSSVSSWGFSGYIRIQAPEVIQPKKNTQQREREEPDATDSIESTSRESESAA
jgi:hypothetical protein